MAVTVCRIRLAIISILKTPKLNYPRITIKTARYLIVGEELVLIGVKHILGPVVKFHLSQVMQTLKHQLVLRVRDAVRDYPNVVEVRLIYLLQYILQAIVTTVLRQLRTESHDLFSERI